MDPLTPPQYMEQHPFTLQLRRLGVTDEQLGVIQFRRNSRESPFDLWQVGWIGDLPLGVSDLIKPYCTLKWLVFDNPTGSRDRDDAWRLVSDAINSPLVSMALRQKEAQRARAQKVRGKVLDDGRTMDELIGEFSLRAEYRDLAAKQLWTHFRTELARHRLDPTEILHDDPQKSAYEYNFQAKRKKITQGQFANVVSRCRNREKIRLAGLVAR